MAYQKKSEKTWESVERKVAEVLVSKLNLDFTPEIERAHRVGKSKKPDGSPRKKPRTIVCRFYDWKVREAVLHTVRKVKDRGGLYISEDLAEATCLK